MKLLIDECLSPSLARLARLQGYPASTHVVWLGLGGWKDWQLKRVIIDGDWTFVTKNSVDFRGPAERAGSRGQYAEVALHAGLICLDGPTGMDIALQIELLEAAMTELAAGEDLVNQVLEVTLEAHSIHILRYALP